MPKYKYPTPPWFKFLFFGFLAYIVLYGMFRGDNGQEKTSSLEKFKNLPSVKALSKPENYVPVKHSVQKEGGEEVDGVDIAPADTPEELSKE